MRKAAVKEEDEEEEEGANRILARNSRSDYRGMNLIAQYICRPSFIGISCILTKLEFDWMLESCGMRTFFLAPLFLKKFLY